MRNFTVQQAEFNAVYVLETDGFMIDKLIARGNDEYGILAFASDHGLIQNVDAYYNGDSGIYPGSASDLNADSKTIAVKRYAIEIRNNKSHDNALGYSGTAGNSVYAHHNKFYDNATGIATDSLFPGHPGLPQDHARWSHNDIYSNNENYYKKYVDTGICAKPMKERGYINGTVCPVDPDPGGHRHADRRRQLQPDRQQPHLRQLALRHHAVLGAGPAARRVRPGEAVRHLARQPGQEQHHGHQARRHGRAQRHGPLVGRPGQRQLLGEQHVLPRQGDQQLRDRPGLVRRRRLQAAARTGRQGRRIPDLQPVRPDDPLWKHPPLCNWFDDPKKPTDARTEGPFVGVLPSGRSGSSP